MKKSLCLVLVATLTGLLLALAGEVYGQTSTQLTVTGDVTNSGATFTYSDLAALPPATATVGADTYTGVSAWGLLNTVGIDNKPSIKNYTLRDYVVATATDGYRTTFSLGEINPAFGHQNDLVAYNLNGSPLTTSGFARTVTSTDIKHGRWVSNLESLNVQHAAQTPGNYTGGLSTSFSVTGQVDNTLPFTLNYLQSFTETFVTTSNGTTYGGVSLWTLLNSTGIMTDPNVKNDILSKFVMATGSDGYDTLISLGEIDPEFGNQPDLIAYEKYVNGNPTLFGSLDPSDSDSLNGFARLIVPGDTKAGRWVSNLVSLDVRNPETVPEPGTVFLMGFGLVGLLGIRKKFKG